MNLHTKITTTFASFIAATAIIVPLAAASANTHPVQITQASSITAQADTTKADDSSDYWAKDAFTAYADPIKNTTTYADTIDGFVATYVGTYSTAPNWGPAYVVVSSTTHPNIWHVFHTNG